MRLLLMLLVAALPLSAATLTEDGGRLLLDGRPAFLRGLWYPLHARRDGRTFEPGAYLEMLARWSLNIAAVSVTDGPTLADAEALLAAAAQRGVPVIVRPLPDSAVARAARRLTASAALVAWAADNEAAAAVLAELEPRRPVLRLASEPTGELAAPDLVLAAPPCLYEPGLGFGDWARLLAAQRQAAARPLVALIPCAPPPWLVAAGALQEAAEQPDLYLDPALRPASVAASAGEYLLVPEPAQIRLATYAALGAGARGVLFDGAGHLCDGPDPFNGADRAATVARLGEELATLEPWLAEADAGPAAPLADGLASALLERGNDRLLLVWRQRRLDSRGVGGRRQPTCDTLVPWPADRPVHIRTLDPIGSETVAVDHRDGGLRLVVPSLDLTRAYLLTEQPAAQVAQAAAAALPRIAARAVLIAGRRWPKVDLTLRRLERQEASAGARLLLVEAANRLVEASEALQFGYLRSAAELGDEVDRILREAQALELETALADPLPETDPLARLTFATLPYQRERRRARPTGPLTLGGDTPVRLDFEALAAGSIPERWHALEGLDQTVATLRVTAAEGGQFLRWSPAPNDPGALYLPFTGPPAGELTVRVRLAAVPGAPRVIGLAPRSGAAPVAGARLGTDAMVSGWPTGASAELVPGAWLALTFRWSGGRVMIRLGERDLTPDGIACPEPPAALVIATFGEDGPPPLDLDDLTVTPLG